MLTKYKVIIALVIYCSCLSTCLAANLGEATLTEVQTKLLRDVRVSGYIPTTLDVLAVDTTGNYPAIEERFRKLLKRIVAIREETEQKHAPQQRAIEEQLNQTTEKLGKAEQALELMKQQLQEEKRGALEEKQRADALSVKQKKFLGIEAELTKTSKTLEAFQDANRQYEEALARVRLERNDFRSKKQRAENAISELQTNMNDLRQELSKKETLIRKTESEKEELSKQISEAQASLRRASFERKKHSNGDEIKQEKARADRVERELQKKIKVIEKLQKDIAQETDQRSKLEELINNLRNEVETLKQKKAKPSRPAFLTSSSNFNRPDKLGYQSPVGQENELEEIRFSTPKRAQSLSTPQEMPVFQRLKLLQEENIRLQEEKRNLNTLIEELRQAGEHEAPSLSSTNSSTVIKQLRNKIRDLEQQLRTETAIKDAAVSEYRNSLSDISERNFTAIRELEKALKGTAHEMSIAAEHLVDIADPEGARTIADKRYPLLMQPVEEWAIPHSELIARDINKGVTYLILELRRKQQALLDAGNRYTRLYEENIVLKNKEHKYEVKIEELQEKIEATRTSYTNNLKAHVRRKIWKQYIHSPSDPRYQPDTPLSATKNLIKASTPLTPEAFMASLRQYDSPTTQHSSPWRN